MRKMLDMMRGYNPTLMVLLEPRISGAGASEVCRRLRKTQWIRSEADGFSGGVWLPWNEDSIKIELLNVSQILHPCLSHFVEWYVLAFYGNICKSDSAR